MAVYDPYDIHAQQQPSDLVKSLQALITASESSNGGGEYIVDRKDLLERLVIFNDARDSEMYQAGFSAGKDKSNK